MKRQVKNMIGSMLVDFLKVPVIRASVNQRGYVIIPEYMQMLKAADKNEDITNLPVFGQLAESVVNSKTACLDYDRLYTIYQALVNTNNMGMFVSAEVGVYRGGTSRFICDVILELGTVIQHRHYGFDTFEGHADQDIGAYDSHNTAQFSDTDYDKVKSLLRGYNCELYRGRFEDRCDAVKDCKFNFVHIDVDLDAPTAHALEFFDRRLDDNGIIIVDDYGTMSCKGVKVAVDAFLRGRKDDYISLHLLTGQMVLFKRRVDLI